MKVVLCRRAFCTLAASAVCGVQNAPVFAGDRMTAQSLGVDQASVLFDPRDISASKGLIWGGRERCDPTDAECQQGGVEADILEQPTPTAPAGVETTDKVRLTLSIANEVAGEIELALWGGAAPDSVDTSMKLCRGTLISNAGDEGASYERSVAVRVKRDVAVVMGALKRQGGQTMLVSGQTRPQRVRVSPPTNQDTNALQHDAAGLLSVKRGGGSFEFSLTTRPNTAMNKESIVIGCVTKGMGLLERLNKLPTNNYDGGPLATVQISGITLLS